MADDTTVRASIHHSRRAADAAGAAPRDVAQRALHILHTLGDAVIATDAGGRVDYMNALAESLTGCQAEALYGRPVEQVLRLAVPPDRRNQTRALLDAARRTRRPQHGPEQAELCGADGIVHDVAYRVSPLHDAHGSFLGATYLVRDMTAHRHRSTPPAWAATHDPLTGTINRGELELRLKQLVRRTAGDATARHVLLHIDIDRFQALNEAHGRDAGDAALVSIATLLRSRIRGADTLARVGGDEFAALLYSCPPGKARLIAEDLRLAAERHVCTWRDRTLEFTLSIGLAAIERDTASVAELLRTADVACDRAKRLGRNRVQIYAPEAAAGGRRARVFDYVKDIRTAIRGQRLELCLHRWLPLAAGPADHACGELDVMMCNGAGERVPPAVYAALSTRHQLAEDIDRWLLKAALDALGADHAELSALELVVVPLSQRALADQRLLDYILTLVRAQPRTAARLGFRLDGAAVLGPAAHVPAFAGALRALGCRVVLDEVEFGAAALGTVRALGADFLSLRAPLVQRVAHDPVDGALAEGFVRIARALGMRTVADGPGNAAARAALARLGVDYVRSPDDQTPQRVAIPSDAQWI